MSGFDERYRSVLPTRAEMKQAMANMRRVVLEDLRRECEEVADAVSDFFGIPRKPSVVDHYVPRDDTMRRLVTPPKKRIRVEITKPEALWIERGWQRQGNVWRGDYVVGDARWHGHAEDVGGYFDFYIEDPPHILKQHHCYVRKRGKTYFVHFAPARPSSVSVGISGVEYQLARALGISSATRSS